MKRLFALGLALVMACGMLLLSACGRSNVASNFGAAVAEWKENEGKKESDTLIGTYTDGEMAKDLGFNVTSYPNSVSLTPDKFFSIDRWFAQLQYVTPDGRSLIMRAASENARTLTRSYDEAHTFDVTTQTIDGVEVEVSRAEKGCTMVSWVRAGFQYVLHSNEKQDPPGDDEIRAFVEGMACEAASAAGSENNG